MPRSPTISYNYPIQEFGITGDYTASSSSGHFLSASTSSSAGNTFLTINGHDYLMGWDGDDRLYAGGGNDIVEGGDGNDTISGGSGDDWLYGDGQYESSFATGDDFIHGGSGNDYLFGAGGDDELNGGQDNDVLEGGTGNDVLIGGSGADQFIFDVDAETSASTGPGLYATKDIIRDFEDGVDKVFYDFGSEPLTFVGYYEINNTSLGVSVGSAGVMINDHLLLFDGVSLSQLAWGDDVNIA